MFADLLLDTYIGTHQVITKDVYAFVQSLDPQLISVWPPLLPPSACLSFIKLVPISQPHVISLLINKPSPMDCVQRQYLKRQFKHQGIKTDIDFRDCSNIDCKKKTARYSTSTSLFLQLVIDDEEEVYTYLDVRSGWIQEILIILITYLN